LLRTVSATLFEGGLIDPAFFHAMSQADFIPDGHYHQDTVSLEDAARRQESWNAAVDAYIAAGIDLRRDAQAICIAAKIGSDGGPLHYRCGCCGRALPEFPKPHWCNGCQALPFCGEACGRAAYARHSCVCGPALAKPLLPSQVALRIGVEVYMVQELTGTALQAAVMRRMGAVQRSFEAARTAAAAAAGVVDE